MLTVNVRPPLASHARLSGRPLRFYTPATDPSTGYGRLAEACMQAVNAVHVSPLDYPDIVLADPTNVSVSPIRFTMWEPTQLPPTATGFMSARALIVPCKMNVRVFRSSGYRGMIHAVPLWGESPWAPMPPDDVFKFVSIGRDNGVRARKGMDELIECFKLAFPRERDVRLTIKSSNDCYKLDPKDDRITVSRETLTRPKYEEMLGAHHCGVFLSGLEGWNFPACELMATGRPSIIVPWGGPADFTTPETSWHLPYTMVQAPDDKPYFGFGQGGKPSRDGVIHALREAYSNRSLLNEKATRSYEMSFKFTKSKFMERLRVVALDILSSV
jgi:glycosyltransferase involved in cell wall biosynthesis